MAEGLGMRGKDLRIFCMVACKYNVYILVRQTNEESLQYSGVHYSQSRVMAVCLALKRRDNVL